MSTTDQKAIAVKFLELASLGRFKDGLSFFSPDCKTHNPYIAGNMDTLTDAMIAANNEGTTKYPDAQFSIKYALADGDFVAVHTELLNNKHKPGEGGLRQVHLFRFEGGKIVEYWDISQQVLPTMPNARGAFGS
jgi:predicted SnoaL-like aldol condensation-catalyzing enzyme